ncbi:MAG: protein CpxP [Phenylobacterium sp.]|jgi:protein CpxP
MKKIISALGLALAVTFATNVVVAKAVAHEDHPSMHEDKMARGGSGMMGMHGDKMVRGGPGMMRMMARLAHLDLTEEQRSAIKTLHQQVRDTKDANKQGHMDFRQQMQDQVRSQSFDEAAVRDIIASKQALRLEMGVMHAKMRNGIWNILTAEQQEQVVAMKGKHRQHRGKHHGRHHGRHHGQENSDDQQSADQ